MPGPAEIEREVERFLEAQPEGGADLMRLAEMVGAILVAMRERKDATPVSAVLRDQGFTEEELERHIVAAMAFVGHMPKALWKHDA